MKKNLLLAAIGGGLMTAVLGGPALAGGLDRGGYNVDLLFDTSRFGADLSGTYVWPDRRLDNVVDTDPSDGIGSDGIGGGATNGVRDSESYFVPRIGLRAALGQNVDCMVDYSQPWGVHSKPGADWMGANNNIETKVESDNYAGTCSYKMDVGKGQFRILGGAFYQEVEGFKTRLVAPVPTLTGTDAFGNGVGRLQLAGEGWGWRAGAAYEIPEIAFRASLVYNSEVNLDDITGTLDLRQVPGFIIPGNPLLGTVTDVFGSQAMPDSVELKVQSGVAPNWLAFGSVKWTDWSQLKSVVFCPTATKGIPCTATGPTRATSLDLFYRDGWVVSGGVGHKFNDQWSAAASLTWDRGTTTGLSSQTDTWTLGGGASYTPNENVELRFGGAIGILTAGETKVLDEDGVTYGDDVYYNFGDDIVTALSTTLKIKW